MSNNKPMTDAEREIMLRATRATRRRMAEQLRTRGYDFAAARARYEALPDITQLDKVLRRMTLELDVEYNEQLRDEFPEVFDAQT